MAFEEVATSQPHVSYACIGFGMMIFVSLALYLKHKFDFSEVILAVLFGLIVGPHALNWFRPQDWAQSSEYLTLELSRVVMDIQIFAAAAELPPKWVWKHWLSLMMMLVPVMIGGYMLNSIFIWKLLPGLRWVEALVIAGCVTATDPVLASAVLSGNFAKKLPGRIVHLLSAESASNDGMALPFMMLPVIILRHEHHAPEIAKEFIVLTVLYEVLFGCVLGAVIGLVACQIFKFASKNSPFREEYILVYNITIAMFCAGVGSIIGVDDFLVSFCAGCGFAWSGWVESNGESIDITGFIDLLLNTSYFVYFGAVIPWEEFNNLVPVWRLIVIAILILVGRRIPVLFILYKIIPDIVDWKEMLISGHFGPIGVAAIYMCLLAKAQLEDNRVVPLPDSDEASHASFILRLLWPATCFIVLSSIIVHGASLFAFKAMKKGIVESKSTISRVGTMISGHSRADNQLFARVQTRAMSGEIPQGFSSILAPVNPGDEEPQAPSPTVRIKQAHRDSDSGTFIEV